MDDYRQGIKHGVIATLLACALFAVIAFIVKPSATEQKFGGTTTSDSLYLRGTLTTDGAATFGGAVSSTSQRVGSGTSVDFYGYTTLTVDPASIGAGQSTTTVVTLTGCAANDITNVNVLSGDLWSTTSTAVLSSRAGSGTVTVNYYNATSTASFNAGSSVLAVQCWSH